MVGVYKMSIENLEELRKTTIKKCNKNNLVFLLIFLVIVGVFFLIFKTISVHFIFIAFIVYIPFGIMNEKVKSEYKNTFMRSLLPIAVKNLLTDVQVDVNSGIPSYVVDSTHSMSTGDRYNSSNFVSGKYKDIKVMMSDVHIQDEHEDSDGHTSYVTIFLGQWMIFDFNKYFKSNVQVWEKKVFGGISRRWKSGLKKVELEDISFNKKFKVLSENELEAFYIITPKLMERITAVEAAINGTLMMVFNNNQLHVAVYNNKTTFNINIHKRINFEEFARESIKDLDAIIKFVDILELDNDLFKAGDVNKMGEPVVGDVAEAAITSSNQGIVAANTKTLDSSVQKNSSIENVDAVTYFNNLNK